MSRERVCTVAEATANLASKVKRKDQRPLCGSMVVCRCNIRACCVCIYAKAHHVCHYMNEGVPCSE